MSHGFRRWSCSKMHVYCQIRLGGKFALKFMFYVVIPVAFKLSSKTNILKCFPYLQLLLSIGNETSGGFHRPQFRTKKSLVITFSYRKCRQWYPYLVLSENCRQSFLLTQTVILSSSEIESPCKHCFLPLEERKKTRRRK